MDSAGWLLLGTHVLLYCPGCAGESVAGLLTALVKWSDLEGSRCGNAHMVMSTGESRNLLAQILYWIYCVFELCSEELVCCLSETGQIGE